MLSRISSGWNARSANDEEDDELGFEGGGAEAPGVLVAVAAAAVAGSARGEAGVVSGPAGAAATSLRTQMI